MPVESALDKVALKALVKGGDRVAKAAGVEELKAAGRFDPALRKLALAAPAPTLGDNRNDVKRLLDALKERDERHLALEFEAIRQLPGPGATATGP